MGCTIHASTPLGNRKKVTSASISNSVAAGTLQWLGQCRNLFTYQHVALRLAVRASITNSRVSYKTCVVTEVDKLIWTMCIIPHLFVVFTRMSTAKCPGGSSLLHAHLQRELCQCIVHVDSIACHDGWCSCMFVPLA